MRVLVTDGEQRSSLAVVRSLGRAGHRILVASSSLRSLASASRFCERAVVLPDPLSRPREFGGALAETTEEHGAEALFPVTDASLGVALSERRALEERGVMLPFAELEAYAAISDKRSALESACGVGIAVPAQVVVPNPDAIEGLDLADLRYPVVFKPSRSVVGEGRARRKTKVEYAEGAERLRPMLVEAPPAAFPILLQERITGPGVGIFLLVWEGKVKAAFAHRRLREKPPSGGVSVLRESAPLDAGLLERSADLLRAFDWRGPAMVEYKVDERTGTPYLMEVNGRYWGSLQLAVDAGVDFPAVHLDAAMGIERSPVTEYEVGVKTRWVLGDFDHLLARLRRTREELGLPPSSPGAGRALLDFIGAFRPGIRNEILHWSDPLPAVVEMARWLRPQRTRTDSTP